MSVAEFQLTLDEAGLARLAAIVALHARPPLCIALDGDLGAGKTTFARALVRALMVDPAHEVPSPTFALRQDYATPAGPVAHFDFYRLSGADDLEELGFDEAAHDAIVIVEWPQRAAIALPTDRIDVFLTESPSKEDRDVQLIGRGRAGALVAAIRTDFVR